MALPDAGAAEGSEECGLVSEDELCVCVSAQCVPPRVLRVECYTNIICVDTMSSSQQVTHTCLGQISTSPVYSAVSRHKLMSTTWCLVG